MDWIFLERLEAECVIGIFRRERSAKQKVGIDLEIACDARAAAARDRVRDTVDYKRIAKTVLEFTRRSRFYLIETLAERVAELVLRRFGVAEVTVAVSKPGAVRFSKNVGVRITRALREGAADGGAVYVSLGSNLNRMRNIRRGIEWLRKLCKVTRMSGIYESTAVGGPPGAGPFWNLVVEMRTPLSARSLKRQLGRLERTLGRKRTGDKFAPRPIDADLVFYGPSVIDEKNLVLPHPEAGRMPYILLPMAEIAPCFRHPVSGKTMIEILGGFLDAKGRFKRVG